METIAICNEGANALHLVMSVSLFVCVCSQTTCHYCGWICFMELCLGSDVYVMTLCICIRPGSGVIEIIFQLYYN